MEIATRINFFIIYLRLKWLKLVNKLTLHIADALIYRPRGDISDDYLEHWHKQLLEYVDIELIKIAALELGGNGEQDFQLKNIHQADNLFIFEATPPASLTASKSISLLKKRLSSTKSLRHTKPNITAQDNGLLRVLISRDN